MLDMRTRWETLSLTNRLTRTQRIMIIKMKSHRQLIAGSGLFLEPAKRNIGSYGSKASWHFYHTPWWAKNGGQVHLIWLGKRRFPVTDSNHQIRQPSCVSDLYTPVRMVFIFLQNLSDCANIFMFNPLLQTSSLHRWGYFTSVVV